MVAGFSEGMTEEQVLRGPGRSYRILYHYTKKSYNVGQEQVTRPVQVQEEGTTQGIKS